MSTKHVAVILLLFAIGGVFVKDRPDALLASIAGRLVLIFVVLYVAVTVIGWLFKSWPSGIEGFFLFVGIFVLGFVLLLPEMPAMRQRQEQSANEWLRKTNALNSFKDKVPSGHSVVCEPNDWDGPTITCRYLDNFTKVA